MSVLFPASHTVCLTRSLSLAVNVDERLRPSCCLADYKLQEVTVVPLNSRTNTVRKRTERTSVPRAAVMSFPVQSALGCTQRDSFTPVGRRAGEGIPVPVSAVGIIAFAS